MAGIKEDVEGLKEEAKRQRQENDYSMYKRIDLGVRITRLRTQIIITDIVLVCAIIGAIVVAIVG